jgi:hypothetical protein
MLPWPAFLLLLLLQHPEDAAAQGLAENPKSLLGASAAQELLSAVGHPDRVSRHGPQSLATDRK